MKTRGRPKKYESLVLISFNIDKVDLEKLDLYCKENYYERTSLINKAIKEYIKNNNN